MIGSYLKRVKGKMFSAILLTMFLVIPTVGVYANESEGVQIDNNTQSVYKFMQFCDKFTQTQLRSTDQNTLVNYPDDYAGAYIDDNDILHINYIENSENKVKDIMIDTNIKYDSVDYSYKLLQDIYNILSSNMKELFISSVYIDELNNNVNVSTNESKYEQIIQVLENNISDFSTEAVAFSPMIDVKYTESGGSTLSNSLGKFTLGYNAYQSSTKYGFVTCGHAVSMGSDVSNSSGTVLGSVTQRTVGGNMDASFIPYKTQSKKTTASLTGPNITGTFSSSQIVVGANVTKYGYASNLTQGKVTSTSASVNNGSDYYADLVIVSNTQIAGDSGGPVVFNFNGPLQPGQARPSTLIGIATMADGNYNGYVSKAANINSSFGITTYTDN